MAALDGGLICFSSVISNRRGESTFILEVAYFSTESATASVDDAGHMAVRLALEVWDVIKGLRHLAESCLSRTHHIILIPGCHVQKPLDLHLV